eukprot:TRINITY_DN22673_c0_g1_i1.p1 TRINITY_DN22673_c0_g1~~TRINITY_DN22673_c0_g1_i1.p1  ORF type:complete len:546 (+),score=122.19 TRINITY_DN22673_c0_g1_i1:94-1731(+)
MAGDAARRPFTLGDPQPRYDGTVHASPPPSTGLTGWLERQFKILERGSTVKTELRGGLVMWMTMNYIIVVNPTILAHGGTQENPMPFGGVATATCITAAFSCLISGLWTNMPFGLMSGMGLNAYFAYGACRMLKIPWQVVLAGGVVHGVIFLALSCLGVCSHLQRLVPDAVKKGITVGIGLFQAFLGFQNIGLVVADPLTLVTLGDVFRLDVLLSFLGVIGIAVGIMRNVPGAMFWGIWVVTAIAWSCGMAPLPRGVMEFPSLDGVLFAADFSGLLKHKLQMGGVIAAFLFVSVFDLAGVMYGICLQMQMLDEKKEVPGGKWAFASSALGSIFGGIVGTSPVIIANETTAGCIEGARTGLAACVAALLFLLSVFFTPLLEAVPSLAASVPLIIVGFFMMEPANYVQWNNCYEALPAYMTVTVMPLSYSIANGVLAGLVTHLALWFGLRVLLCFGIDAFPKPTEGDGPSNPCEQAIRRESLGAARDGGSQGGAIPPHRVTTPYLNEDFHRTHSSSMLRMPSPVVRGVHGTPDAPGLAYARTASGSV